MKITIITLGLFFGVNAYATDFTLTCGPNTDPNGLKIAKVTTTVSSQSAATTINYLDGSVEMLNFNYFTDGQGYDMSAKAANNDGLRFRFNIAKSPISASIIRFPEDGDSMKTKFTILECK
jgi:hypothetical protein